MQRSASVRSPATQHTSSPSSSSRGRSTSNISTTSTSYEDKLAAEEDILNSVSNIYFQDAQQDESGKGIDLVELILSQPTVDLADEASILTELNKYEKVLGVVNNRLGKTVMNNYNSFVDGMTNVQEVGADLTMTSLMCRNGRKRIKKAQEDLVKGGLMIVAQYRKKKSLKNVEHYLQKIKEVVDSDKEMNQLLEDGNFPAAIKLMLDHRQSVLSMNQFYCIQQLDRNIKNVYQRMESKMKEALLSLCASFDNLSYERILVASKELSLGEISSDITKNYTDAVDQLLKEVVLSFAMQNPKVQNIESLVKMDYQNLCKKIHFDHVLSSLLRSLSTVSDIMYNYYQMYSWHLQEKEHLKDYDFKITKTNLDQFRKILWENIQKKISIFLESCDLSHFKIDKYLQVYHSVNMLCQLGEEFSQSNCFRLQRAINAKSNSYFTHYHKDILENIKTMVENENWQPLDSVVFNMNDIPEFRSKSNNALDSLGNVYEEYSKKVRQFLKSNDRESNPFKLAFDKGSFLMTLDNDQEEEKIDDYSSSSSSSSEDEDEEYVNKKKQKKKKKKDSEVYTNVSLTMLKRMGVYIQAMEVLQPICLDVFSSFTTLFKFYLYIVHALFANISPSTVSSTVINLDEDFSYPENDTRVSESLQKTFKNIREELNKCAKDNNNGEPFFKIPKVSQMINIKQPPLFGLYERSVAAESVTFLYNAVEKIIEKRMEELIPKNKRSSASQFLKSMKSATEEVKDCIYGRTVKYLLFDFPYMEKYPDKIANYKYHIQVMGDQCNKFVFELRDDIKKFFSIKLQTIDDRLPENSINFLWDLAVKYVIDVLVEGFSRVKKCNNEGRVLMQLDLQTFTTELQRMVPSSLIEKNKGSVPHVAIARSYIQAYYEQNESDLLEWVKKNVHNFTVKQMVAIATLNFGTNLKKNELKLLTSQVEQLATSLKMQKEHVHLMENSSTATATTTDEHDNHHHHHVPITSITKEESGFSSMIRSGSFASTKELLSSLTRSGSSTTIAKDSQPRTSIETSNSSTAAATTNSTTSTTTTTTNNLSTPSTSNNTSSRTSIDSQSRPSFESPHKQSITSATTDKMKNLFQGGMSYLKRAPANNNNNPASTTTNK